MNTNSNYLIALISIITNVAQKLGLQYYVYNFILGFDMYLVVLLRRYDC